MKDTTLVHVGIVGDRPGGMAQVVTEVMSWSIPDFRQQGWLTTTGRRDILSIFRAAIVAFKIILLSRSSQRPLLVFHLSERGSFLREGGLLWLASLIGLPTVAHLHGADFVDFAQKRPGIVRRVLSRATGVIALTEKTADEVRLLLSGRVNLRIIANGVSVPEMTEPKVRQFLFCGEVGARKGVDTLLEAWNMVTDDIPEWKLIIAGPLTNDYRHIEQVLPKRAEYMGVVSRDRALAMQAVSLAVVLPSRAEALPMFLIESMARSCAPISTPVGQVPQLISHDRGRLIPIGDVESLVASLREVALTPGLPEALGAAARQAVKANYSSHVVGAQLASFWTSCLRVSA